MGSTDALQIAASEVREYLRFFRELGVEYAAADIGALERTTTVENVIPAPAERQEAVPPPHFKPISFETPAKERPKAGARLAGLPTLGPRPESRKVNAPKGDLTQKMPTQQAATDQSGSGIPTSDETLEQIRADIGPDCSRCKLSTLGRMQVVNSTGNRKAELMFVGEAPGADEDKLGEPFVGRAGQLLTKIIESIGLERKDVFIGNINRCRPPKNRAPESDETAACKPFLLREISVVRPKVIVVLGATAAQNLLETNVPIGKLRGRFHDYYGVKVMPTFHPAYLLRDPSKKRETWEDMKIVRDHLNALKGRKAE
ncbi:MAG: uracil-DNA glycosylase, family 4 [Acidobacteria bacterium OLB17]|nr:MAG: uracil-DNA glycosylase, family 4 [Acidobacteria bacterium OLB17]MCZ2389750.1 uracil-DNA glycosylase [Acidobacteriota bacterium]